MQSTWTVSPRDRSMLWTIMASSTKGARAGSAHVPGTMGRWVPDHTSPKLMWKGKPKLLMLYLKSMCEASWVAREAAMGRRRECSLLVTSDLNGIWGKGQLKAAQPQIWLRMGGGTVTMEIFAPDILCFKLSLQWGLTLLSHFILTTPGAEPWHQICHTDTYTECMSPWTFLLETIICLHWLHANAFLFACLFWQ